VTIDVPQGTETVVLEATEQLAAVNTAPPLSVTPVDFGNNEMMQAVGLGLTSA
jgi:hypothetical protein